MVNHGEIASSYVRRFPRPSPPLQGPFWEGTNKMETVFYFDRIKIETLRNPNFLKSELPLNELNLHSKEFEIQKVNYETKFHSVSRIDVVAPTLECLQLLFKNEETIGPYRISYIEIAKNILINDREKADSITRQFVKFARKRWSKKSNPYDQFGDHDPITFDPEKWNTITAYLISKNFEIHAYADDCKVTGIPCFHREYKITQSPTISKKTNIHEIGDLIGFNFQHWFDKTDKRYLTFHERIDRDRLGLAMLGWTKRKTFSRRNRWSIGLTGSQYSYERTPAQLINYLQGLKREIRKKRQLTQWDIRILKLNTSYFLIPKVWRY